VDTNCNPQGIDYIIPSNDDAIRAIKLLVARAADAVLEGKAMRKEQEIEEGGEAAAEGAAETSFARTTARVVESDEEMEEGALLGESTLAKLSATANRGDGRRVRRRREPSHESTEPAPAAAAADETTATTPDAAN